MIPYPHFALPNIYLVNGYSETRVDGDIEYEYERLDDLEQCIRRILIRAPRRFRGWDLRYLRRGLNLSQTDFGCWVDRDAQTVARWEKSSDLVPAFVDLTIRVRFAARFEPWLTVGDITAYADGRGNALPSQIPLTLTPAGWTFDIEPRVSYFGSATSGQLFVGLPASRGSVVDVLQYDAFQLGTPGQMISRPARSFVESDLIEMPVYFARSFGFVTAFQDFESQNLPASDNLEG